MKYFCVNKNGQSYPENGEHEVHREGCPTPPWNANKHDLGDCSNCYEAVRKAKQVYDNVDGCANCCPDCHTK